ncbi:cholinesterase [Blastomyces dermatitidis ATCC 18188]|uniref:Carboxylic ester hydrolase n=1 Tax=Ajellomyces dermatitidis (strain ATCC 18188 / CBS 674.68) TaxID=653446 RepID=F2TER0_AJEDA|nr:cholinesterase [Blastomyces dermatitidis ATCC 18188]
MASLVPFICLLLFLSNTFQSAHAVEPLVNLGYVEYKGVENPGGVTQWLGMRYAAPPLGNLRFSAPEDPVKEKKKQRADKFGHSCLATRSVPRKHTSEDCLFINVYGPSNSKSDSKLPVYFYIQGGGFNANAGARLNGTGLVEASGMNIIVVTFNYRVGLYGFLASKEIREKASLNNGLKDQMKALEWVNKHIKQFGGDPGHVTIGGDSAGAASVYYLLSAFGGRGVNTFHAAAAGSPSFGTQLNIRESQYMYDNLVKNTKCTGKDSLACLRKVDVKRMQKLDQRYPLPGGISPPLFMYSPTVDGHLIQDYTYKLFARGQFKKVPMIFGADNNEGTVFVPRNTSSFKESDTFLKNQFPAMQKKHFRKIHELYPKTNDVFAEAKRKYGPYWRQGSNAYGEMRYNCPAIILTVAGSMHGDPSKVWNFHYDVEDPPAMKNGIGVPHTAHMAAIWGPKYAYGPGSYRGKGVNAPIVPVVQGYWTSFIRSYDPNIHRVKGSPVWGTVTTAKTGKALHQLYVKTRKTKTRLIDKKQIERCEYLLRVGAEELKM